MRTTSRALLATGLAVAVAALAGCTDPSAPAGPVRSTPAASSPAPTLPAAVPSSGAGSDGLTVRYLGPDGTLKTLPAEDFPR